MTRLTSALLLLATILSPISAWAGNGATLVFREGHVAYVQDGYQVIADAYKRLKSEEKSHEILEMSLNGSSFLLNLSEVVIVCRDKCSGLEISDPRKTSKAN